VHFFIATAAAPSVDAAAAEAKSGTNMYVHMYVHEKSSHGIKFNIGGTSFFDTNLKSLVDMTGFNIEPYWRNSIQGLNVFPLLGIFLYTKRAKEICMQVKRITGVDQQNSSGLI
jgi:hypothetical protein